MCPFDLPLHHEKNHLNKQGWCKFIALIWIVLLCFSCSLQNPEDLFRITQTLNMSDSHPKAFCHIFHSASRALSTVSPWQYKYECNLLAGHLALQRDHQLYNQSNNVYVFLMQFGGFWEMMYIKGPQYQTRYSVVTWYASLPVHYTPDMSHSLIKFKIHSTLC